jgi:hypothetical protein
MATIRLPTPYVDDYYTRAEWETALRSAKGDGRGMACYKARRFLERAGD